MTNTATPSPPSRWPWLLLAGLVLALDQWSKWLVQSHLPLFASYPVIPGFLSFTHVENPGVAFGFLASTSHARGPWVVTVLGFLALVFVAHLFLKSDPRDRLMMAALALIGGGAVGNLVDRITQGAVTDFVDAYVGNYHWHTFNVADSAISVGLVVLLLDGLRHRRAENAAEATAAENP